MRGNLNNRTKKRIDKINTYFNLIRNSLRISYKLNEINLHPLILFPVKIKANTKEIHVYEKKI